MIDKDKFYLKSELARELGLTWESLKARISTLIPKLREKHQYTTSQKMLSPAICREIIQYVNGENPEEAESKAE